MEIKKIEEGMTAPQVAQLIDDNFKGLHEAIKSATEVKGDFKPDEEDLTAKVVEGKVVAKLKDRDTTKGKGYIILRNEKPIEEQIIKENTIYEVRYNFDLNGKTIEVPDNSVLNFKGGSFINGALLGNNTMISAKGRVFTNVAISGTFSNAECYTSWCDDINMSVLLGDNILLDSDITISKTIYIPVDKRLLGNGHHVYVDIDIAEAQAINMARGSIVENITIESINKQSKASTSYYPTAYEYDKNIDGVAMNNDCICNNVTIIGTNKGFISGEKEGIYLNNCQTKDTGWGAVSFYHCKKVFIKGGSYVNCGSFGGVMLPSCQGFTISGIYVYNPTSTGINPGGSAASGYNVVDGIVSNCTVEAGDCISFENGADNCVIDGNICYIHSITNNGVGIGVLSHNGGGPNRNIAITGNFVQRRVTSAGECIVLGVINSDNGDFTNVTVVGNATYGGRVGFNLNKTVTNIVNANISNNNFLSSTSAMWIRNLVDSRITHNVMKCTTTTTISNYYGCYFIGGENRNIVVDGNTTIGFGSHYRQDANCINSTFSNAKTIPNEDGASYSTITYADNVTGKLSLPSYISYSVSGRLTGSGSFAVKGRTGIISINANVNYTPDSNESCGLWFYMNNKGGTNAGYSSKGVTVIPLAAAKHDFGGAIADITLTGSSDSDTVTVNAGGFNIINYRVISLS